jgi:polysaccharide deacetylase 2 family uncharacterized protein YibQ
VAKTKSRKKMSLEDGVHSALIAGVLICVVVLAAAGFFAARSILGGGFIPPPLDGPIVSDGPDGLTPESPTGDGLPKPAADRGPETSGEDILPDLEAEIRRLESQAETAETTDPSRPPNGTEPETRAKTAVQKNSEIFPPERRGILVFVIDDAGNNLANLDPFLKFPGPLTIAVLPGLPYSAETAKRIRNAKKEVFLHQPMEPLGGQDPGPGAVKTGMSRAEIRNIINSNLDSVWPVAGFNNHEGSKATMDFEIMTTTLELSHERGLFFLDSRTIADSAAPKAARDLGITIAERDVFLDNEQDRDSIIRCIEEGCRKAEQYGTAIMIGHVWSPKLAGILTEMYPKLIKQGFFLTTVSGILNAGK